MPMDFTSAGQRVRSLIAAKKPQQLATSALTPDVLRDNVVEEGIEHSPRFRAAAEQRPRVDYHREQDGAKVADSFEWSTFGEAMRDVARGAYEYNEPQLRPRDQVRGSHLFNREVIGRVLQSPEFQDSRPYTRDNADEAIFGAQAAAGKMLEMAPDAAEHIARSEEMAEQENEIQDAEDMLEELREQAREQNDELYGIDPGLVEQIKDVTAQRQKARGKLGQLIDEHIAAGGAQTAQKIGAAAAQALQDAVETLRLSKLIPGCEPGSPHNLKPGAQIALAEKLMQYKQLREILEMVGRLVNDMRFKRQARSKNVAIEPVGVTTGNDVTRLLPTELGRMNIPALRPLWAIDWANRALLEWEMGGKLPAGKGPIIDVVDGSGSMSGRPFIWASALAVAMLSMAQREKRDFACVEFGSSGQMKSWIFPGADTPDPEQVLDMATHFFAGGTDITTGLREAKRIIETVPAFKTADVVILSDGADSYDADDERIVHDLQALDVRIHGISILTPGNAYLEQACEYVIDVSELVGANAATDALAQNIT